MKILGAYMVPHPPMIVKEIGRGSEKQVKKTIDSYEIVAKEISKLKPDTIIISSPHTNLYMNHFFIMDQIDAYGSFEQFMHPEVYFHETIDEELTKEIIKNSLGKIEVYGDNKETQLDHGTMVPLYFIRKYYQDFKIVLVGLSGKSFEDHFKLGKIIKESTEKLDRKVVYIASGDLSHKLQPYGPYGFVKEGPIYDQKIMDIMKNANFEQLLTFDKDLCNKAAECGHRSFIIMSGFLNETKVRAQMLSHEDTTGVGYGIVTYSPIDIYVELAKQTINTYIKENRKISFDNIPKELLSKRSGVFVSIHKNHQLRGCIGTIFATEDNIAKEIIRNAIAASTEDPRFDPITEEELDSLEINVDELGPLEVVSSREELDEKKYGIVITSGFKRGVLLPNLDNVNSVEEQIEITLRKGNIDKNENYQIERFEVIRHI